MSTKSKLLQEIEKKAQKIRERRVEAASNKSLESAAFEFFKKIEESRKLHNGERYDSTLFTLARRALQQRIQGFDKGTKVSIEFNINEDINSTEEQTVRGVTIWWSASYIAKHNISPSMYIDISQMLFI